MDNGRGFACVLTILVACGASSLERARDAERQGRWGDAMTAYARAYGDDAMFDVDYFAKLDAADKAMGTESLCRALSAAYEQIEADQKRYAGPGGYGLPALNRAMRIVRESQAKRCARPGASPPVR